MTESGTKTKKNSKKAGADHKRAGENSTAGATAAATAKAKKKNPSTDKKKMALAKVAAAKQRAKTMFSMMPTERPDILSSDEDSGKDVTSLPTTYGRLSDSFSRSGVSLTSLSSEDKTSPYRAAKKAKLVSICYLYNMHACVYSYM